MTLDHIPSAIVTETFGEWLDYTLLGAEEPGRLTEEDCNRNQVLYHHPRTPCKRTIRAACKLAAPRPCHRSHRMKTLLTALNRPGQPIMGGYSRWRARRAPFSNACHPHAGAADATSRIHDAQTDPPLLGSPPRTPGAGG